MFKNRILVVLGVLSLLLVAMGVSLPLSDTLVSGNSNVAPAKYVNADYHQRHPELRPSADIPANDISDYFQRHNHQRLEIPVTGPSAFPDYFQRHPELRLPAGLEVDMTDYFIRHPELRAPIESTDLSDYFLRH